MLTRCAKHWQFLFAIVLVISSHFVAIDSGSVCCSRRSQKLIKPLILGVQGLSKLTTLIQLKSSSLVLVVVGSMPMCICNRFYEGLANSGKITTFVVVRLFLCTGFLERRKSILGPSKSTFNAKTFIRSLSLSVSVDFTTIRSWNVFHSWKLPKKSTNTSILVFKVIQGRFNQSKGCVQLPISD